MTAALVERPHGTRARYVWGPGTGRGPGCRCAGCTAANRDEHARISRLRAYGQWLPFVDAEPARAHVRALARAGIGWKRAAELAGLPEGTMRKLLQGGSGARSPSRRIRPETAAAILAVQPAAGNLGAAALVDAAGTQRRLQALVVIGWSQAKLAERLGMSAANFGAVMRCGHVTAATARAVAGLYDQLWNRPPPEGGQREKIAASRARNFARQHGWAPPLAWDDDQIDVPEGKPADGWQRPASTRRRAAELAETASELSSQGFTRVQAAERLDVSRAALDKALSRARAAPDGQHEADRARFAVARAALAGEYHAEAG